MIYSMKRNANKFGKFFSKPGAFVYNKTYNLIGTDKVEMFFTTIVSFLIITAMLFEIFPLQSTMHTVVLIVIGLFTISVCIGLINFLVPLVLNIICKFTEPFAYINMHCKQNLDSDLENEPRFTTSTGVGVGPKAEVGIKYFIELEKKNSSKGFYRAKYISE